MVAMTPAWTRGAPSPRPPAGHDNDRSDRTVGDETDGALVRACRDGDGRAWDTLVGRYERLVFSVALRNGLEREDAADVTQEVFVALLDALDSLRDDTRLASWLMTVARRKAWRTRERFVRSHPAPADVAADATLAADPLDSWTSLTALHDAVSDLGEPCRTLIHELYLDADQPSYAEIAARMGRSIGGIGPLRGRCLERLRGMVGDEFR